MTAIQPPPNSTRAGSVVLLPGDRFFVRRIALTSDQDAAAQVELALETVSPFAPAQLFHGYCVSKNGRQALLFAAYRKSFTPEEVATWASVDAVLPEFVVWLGQENPPAAGVWIREGDRAVEAVAWDGKSELPAGILFRQTEILPAEILAGELQAELARRFHLPESEAEQWSGGVAVEKWTKEELLLRLDGSSARLTRLTTEQVRLMDVRDKAELVQRAQQQRRDLWLWRAFAGVAAGLALCLLTELSLLGAGRLLAARRSEVADNTAAVQRIDQANALAARMEQIATQRLMPFEMLVVLNETKPAALTFVRATTSGPLQMEIEAQTSNAADLHDYEQRLGKAAAIEKVEVRDPHTRDNQTSFLLEVTFKRGFFRTGGGT